MVTVMVMVMVMARVMMMVMVASVRVLRAMWAGSNTCNSVTTV
jgi:hypothetical protein